MSSKLEELVGKKLTEEQFDEMVKKMLVIIRSKADMMSASIFLVH